MSTRTIQLFVQIENKTVQISAEESWSILQLKQHLYLYSNTPTEDLRVIFAGTELANSVLLKNCHFACGTTVHAIVVKSKGNSFAPVVPTNFIGPTPQGIATNHNDQIDETKRSRFYLFCKNCNAVKIGKLRVRCKKCKDEAFELSKGPDSWIDILTVNRITGLCNSQNDCDGNIAEFYFKCENHERSLNDSENVIALPLLRTNTQSVPCLACTDISGVVLVFPCEEKHVICIDCFSLYCETSLNTRHFILKENIGYTLPCPGFEEACNKCFIEEIHHFIIAGKTQYERYKNFAAEDFVLQNGGLLCPGKDCGNGIFLEHDQRKIVCFKSRGGCGFAFCRNCLLAYHDGECISSIDNLTTKSCYTYEISQANAMHAKWRDEAKCRDTIAQTTKPCPRCRSRTEKSGGCNHMQCARCNLQWCWLCLVEWGRNCESDHWFRAS
ncbi:E3 ubiquitin-protein ligase parkin isoform X1 [Hydra vulgaris]|uniref:E3 ubiquitin-protein ligase parkin isoform X1 n=1 Tax=Hydra vulgaris TaxID=6087 RepID=UPI001F5EBA39|nr:E3 ubiquitin-protein ligase parkin-like isoform X1 [Hydra vulgaris]